MSRVKRKSSKALVYLYASKIHGIGCFADMPIRKGEFVRVWDPEDSEWIPLQKAHASRHKELYKRFGIRSAGGYWAPPDFLRMSAGWYMNHSTAPNLLSDDGEVTYYAARNIAVGEELTIDYRRMDEDFDNLSRDEVIRPARKRQGVR
jgi:SET domain-containing protein